MSENQTSIGREHVGKNGDRIIIEMCGHKFGLGLEEAEILRIGLEMMLSMKVSEDGGSWTMSYTRTTPKEKSSE